MSLDVHLSINTDNKDISYEVIFCGNVMKIFTSLDEAQDYLNMLIKKLNELITNNLSEEQAYIINEINKLKEEPCNDGGGNYITARR